MCKSISAIVKRNGPISRRLPAPFRTPFNGDVIGEKASGRLWRYPYGSEMGICQAPISTACLRARNRRDMSFSCVLWVFNEGREFPQKRCVCSICVWLFGHSWNLVFPFGSLSSKDREFSVALRTRDLEVRVFVIVWADSWDGSIIKGDNVGWNHF